MKLIDRFSNLSIKRKITYLYLPLAIVPVIVFALMSMNLYENAIVSRSLGSMEDNNVLIRNQVESILDDMESCATLLTISINNLYRNEALSAKPVIDVFFDNSISNELAYSKLIFKGIDSIAYVDKDYKLYYTDSKLSDNFFLFPDSELLSRVSASTGNNIWIEMDDRGYLTRHSEQVVITLGKKVWNIDTGETLGYLFINVDQSTLADLFRTQRADYLLVDEAGLVVSSSIEEIVLEDIDNDVLEIFLTGDLSSNVISIDNRKRMLSKIEIDRLGWTLLGEADLDDFTEDLTNLILLTGIIVGTLILLEITMSILLNNLITNPITKLREGIDKVSQGEFDLRFKMKTQDEIGVFAESFNHMSSKIKELLAQVEDEAQKKREYELALIQQQIKPHFLYNTLDIILKLSQMGQNKKAQKATRRLADYYKSSLSGGEDIVTVDKEIRITRDYLELQKIRYSELFEYTIHVDEGLMGYEIPKLTLQPLVENAIYHGLKYKEDFGHIEIRGEITEEGAVLTVFDDGVGLSDVMLKNITMKRPGHFGLYNVDHRLMLFSGGDCYLEYESVPGEYTKAKVVFQDSDTDCINMGKGDGTLHA